MLPPSLTLPYYRMLAQITVEIKFSTSDDVPRTFPSAPPATPTHKAGLGSSVEGRRGEEVVGADLGSRVELVLERDLIPNHPMLPNHAVSVGRSLQEMRGRGGWGEGKGRM
jgi:hypothetical protein